MGGRHCGTRERKRERKKGGIKERTNIIFVNKDKDESNLHEENRIRNSLE